MATFSKRHGGYKAGVILFLVALVMFIVGFATPNWCEFVLAGGQSGSTTKDFVVKGHAGLWTTCVKGSYGESYCVSSDQSSGWMLAVEGLQGAAVALLAISLFYAVHVNFLAAKPPTCKVLGIGIGLAGGLGLSGAVTYATKIEQDENFLNDLEGNHNFQFDVSWSFGVNVAACALLLLSTAIVSVFDRPLPPQQSPATFSNLNTAGMPMGAAAPAPGTVHIYATPVNMAGNPQMMYTAPPPAYYSSIPDQGQAQAQAQASAPMVFNTPVPEGTKQ